MYVFVSVGHVPEPCKNGWTDGDAVLGTVTYTDSPNRICSLSLHCPLVKNLPPPTMRPFVKLLLPLVVTSYQWYVVMWCCVQVIYVKLSVLMGLGWVVGFVAAFADWPALWYVFIVVNSLQGALLCVAFVVTRQVARLFVDCVRPPLHGAPSDTGKPSSNDLKSRNVPGDSTEVARMSDVWQQRILFAFNVSSYSYFSICASAATISFGIYWNGFLLCLRHPTLSMSMSMSIVDLYSA